MNVFQSDLVIIGAGIVGAAIARELSRFDLQVSLLDRENDLSSGTSKANSGIVHSGLHDRPGTLKSRLCVEGNRLYPDLCASLDVPYEQNGALVVAQSADERFSLEKLYLQGGTNGVTGLKILSQGELRILEPHLATDLTGALSAPTTGIVLPFELVFALTENAVRNGVRLFLDTSVQSIDCTKTEFVIHTQRGDFHCQYLINAAGTGSGRIAAMVGDDSFSIRLRKGEEYLLDRRWHGLVQRTVFPLPTAHSKGILLIPTVDGNIMLGPTAQETLDEEDRATTSEGWAEVYRLSRRLLPTLQSKDLIASFAGLRAVSDRDDFIIEASPVNRRLIHAAGIQSPGLTAAPAIARYIVELLADAGLVLKPNDHFQPERHITRLRHLDREIQGRLIAQEPGYGRIVCRCEQISELEVRAAIRRGAHTLDGVKLRTRCGMGRCQGGFCTPPILKILSEELGVPITSITKKGPGSEVVAGYLRPREEGDDIEKSLD
jgi:glycerol-3-phosphate dehydrogenase